MLFRNHAGYIRQSFSFGSECGGATQVAYALGARESRPRRRCCRLRRCAPSHLPSRNRESVSAILFLLLYAIFCRFTIPAATATAKISGARVSYCALGADFAADAIMQRAWENRAFLLRAHSSFRALIFNRMKQSVTRRRCVILRAMDVVNCADVRDKNAHRAHASPIFRLSSEFVTKVKLPGTARMHGVNSHTKVNIALANVSELYNKNRKIPKVLEIEILY